METMTEIAGYKPVGNRHFIESRNNFKGRRETFGNLGAVDLAAVPSAGSKICKRAVMRDAHRQYAQMRPLGWDWSRSLRFAWARAKAGAQQ